MAAASPSSRPRSRAGSSGSLEAAYNARPPRPPSAKGRVRPSSSHAAGGAATRASIGGDGLTDGSAVALSPPSSPPGWFPPSTPRSELAGGRATPRPPSAAPRPPSARTSYVGGGTPVVQRPTLNRYSVLPAIRGGRSTDDGDEGDADESRHQHDAEAGIDALSLRGDEEPRPHSRPLYRQQQQDHHQQDHHQQQDHQQQDDKESGSLVPGLSSPSLLLAVRLPSGERVERHFSPDETLSAVLAFALSRRGNDGQRGEEETAVVGRRRWVVGAGRARYTDLTRSLRSCDVRDRTLLYLFLEEDD
uniref:UBX domain-containing protein 10 n=1 Tax=Petromyzon marinus TaxID=7757 RepID=A0AAJ7TK18_PETMA|nr:UBX domain-containing protein 10 [Petromyzon marinus]XP_032818028.1 UBX domain-containing protein 10 [Petromyzon marinus]